MFPEEISVLINDEEVSGYLMKLDTLVMHEDGVSYPVPVGLVWIESEAKIVPIELESITLVNPKNFTKKLIEYSGLQKI